MPHKMHLPYLMTSQNAVFPGFLGYPRKDARTPEKLYQVPSRTPLPVTNGIYRPFFGLCVGSLKHLTALNCINL
jgi:hypothetical protein